MKISPSLFSKKKDLNIYARQLETVGVDCIHIDYLQGTEELISPKELNEELSLLPFDVHIISDIFTEDNARVFNETTTEYLCIQFENLIDKTDIKNLTSFKGKKGIGITIDTPLSVIDDYYNYIDFLLIMCSQPGISGAKFQEDNFERIREIKQSYPELSIHADGGIEREKASIMRQFGVSLIVCGSYLANSNEISLIDKMIELNYSNGDVRVSSIMQFIEEDLICNINDDFIKLVEMINKMGKGIAFAESNGKFSGIITDGDIRRKILKVNREIFNCSVEELINKTPYFVSKNATIRTILKDRMIMGKALTVIPVVEKGKLLGMIDLDEFTN